MADLELTRTQGDRRLYALEGVGTLRLEGLFSRAAIAEGGGASWRIARSGFWRRRLRWFSRTAAVSMPSGFLHVGGWLRCWCSSA